MSRKEYFAAYYRTKTLPKKEKIKGELKRLQESDNIIEKLKEEILEYKKIVVELEERSLEQKKTIEKQSKGKNIGHDKEMISLRKENTKLTNLLNKICKIKPERTKRRDASFFT